MKILLSLALLLPLTLRAQSVSGTELEIGWANFNQIPNSPARYSGAVGYHNSVVGSYSFSVGGLNFVSSNYALAVGGSNWIAGARNAAIGQVNNVGATESLAVGNSNDVFANSSANLISGSYNQAGGDVYDSLVAGTNNFVRGDELENPDDPDYLLFARLNSTITLGLGLYNRWNASVVVGRYNDSTIPSSSDLLLVVGNGADADHRSNALEIYGNGRIQMPRQGDILMGEFGNPEP